MTIRVGDIVKKKLAKGAFWVGRVVCFGIVDDGRTIYVMQQEEGPVFVGFRKELEVLSMTANVCRHDKDFSFIMVKLGKDDYTGGWECCLGCGFTLNFNPNTGLTYLTKPAEGLKELTLTRSGGQSENS